MVGLHATADTAGQPFPEASPQERLAPMLLRAVLYSARTELFLMISILLLLMSLDRTPRGYGTVIRSQVRRLLIPFLFWTVFYAGYGLIKAQAFGYSGGEISRLSDPAAWIGFLLLGDVKYHMHFIPTLFALVLFYPLFRVAERQPVWGLLIVLLLLFKRELDGIIYPALWNTEALPYVLRLVKVSTYIGYGLAAAAVLGFWRRFPAPERASWAPLIAIVAAFLFVFKLVSVGHVVSTGAWDFAFEPGYWADFLMPVLLLALAMCFAEWNWPKWISRASKFSFGIYLCHPIFLDLIEVQLRGTAWSPMAQVLTELVWTIPLTCLLVFVLSKLPSLAWTIGLGPVPVFASRREVPAHLK